MKCKKVRADIITDTLQAEELEHLKTCPTCSSLYKKVNSTLEILDMDVEIPAQLEESILEQVKNIKIPKTRNINISTLIQIAAAILFGIIIGHQFGQYVSSNGNTSTPDPLTQYIKAHHFNIENINPNSSIPFVNSSQ